MIAQDATNETSKATGRTKYRKTQAEIDAEREAVAKCRDAERAAWVAAFYPPEAR